MSKYNYTLKKKTSLVTGAAGYLGETISETLSALESNIILVDSDKKKLTIMVDHTFLFTSAVKKMKEIVDDNPFQVQIFIHLQSTLRP